METPLINMVQALGGDVHYIELQACTVLPRPVLRVFTKVTWNFAKVEILYENGLIFAKFGAISYIFVLLSLRHFV
jgi:hypothetical protein